MKRSGNTPPGHSGEYSGKRRSYKGQAKDKTIKSVSLSKDLVEYGEAEAKRARLPFSRWLEMLLAEHFDAEGK